MKKITDNLKLPSHLPQSKTDHLLDKFTSLYFGLARLGITINQSRRLGNEITLDIEGIDQLLSLELASGEYFLFGADSLPQPAQDLLNHLDIGIE